MENGWNRLVLLREGQENMAEMIGLRMVEKVIWHIVGDKIWTISGVTEKRETLLFSLMQISPTKPRLHLKNPQKSESLEKQKRIAGRRRSSLELS
jgi:hypothetical protein